MAGFRSLRQRMAGGPDPNEVLSLHVEPHLNQPLLNWLAETCDNYWSSERWDVLAQALKIDYTGRPSRNAIMVAINADNDLILDLLDFRLKLGTGWEHQASLADILFLGGSGYRLTDGKDGLEKIVDETVRAAALAAMDAAEPSAAEHLREAWSATLGRNSNPTQAHAEMVRAVESASRPVVTPNNGEATLGTIIGQMTSQAALYSTHGASEKNDGIGAVVAMMRMVWQQQTDRHGANPTIPATQRRVEFLLPVTAALVHAFSTGAVFRK